MGLSVGRCVAVALGKGDLEAVRGYWATGNLVAIPFPLLMAGVFAFVGPFFGPYRFEVAPENVKTRNYVDDQTRMRTEIALCLPNSPR